MSIESRTPIDDIVVNDSGLRVLDSADKIVRWIEYQYEEQEINHILNPEIPFHRYIELSSCVISTRSYDGKPSLMNLCDIAGKIECVIKTSKDYPHKTPFHQEVLEEIRCNDSILYGAFFHCTKFHQGISFSNTIINGGDFSRCEFLDYAFFQKCKLAFGSFESSIFHKGVYFSESEFDHFQVIFRGCIFRDDANFKNIKINEISDITLLSHSRIDFSRSTFSKGFNFIDIDIPTHCWFEECIFEQVAILRDIISRFTISFAGATIKNRILISASKEDCKNQIEKLIISHLDITGRFDIENSNINIFRANFTNLQDKSILRLFHNNISNCDMDSICNRGIIMFEEDNLSNIILDSAINVGIIELENTKIDAHNITSRKTARILKDSAYKSNNIIDGLKYKALELEIHKSEKTILWYDKFILFLNKFSNGYDLNFIKGICFTIGTAVLFFWAINYWGTANPIFELNYHFDFTGFGEVWKKYLDVLNVLNFRDKLNGIELNAFGETMFLLSKIFIAYGMYQTVSAFRKFIKNP